MKIIILGANSVGIMLAQKLFTENENVVLVAHAGENVDRIDIGCNVIRGFVSHPEVLDEAGADGADAIIAVTHDDEINMIACHVGDSLFNIPLRIAKIASASYIDESRYNFSKMGLLTSINYRISPEMEVAHSVTKSIQYATTNTCIQVYDDKISIISIVVANKSLCDMSVFDVITKSGIQCNIIAIHRRTEFTLVDGDALIHHADLLYIVCQTSEILLVHELFNGEKVGEYNSVVIVGGGRIGSNIIRLLLENNVMQNITIVEKRQKVAKSIAQQFSNAKVICGDIFDSDIITEISGLNVDISISATDSDTVNIMSSLIMKKLGYRNAVSIVDNIEHSGVISSLGVDSIVNPTSIIISKIMQYMRKHIFKNINFILNGSYALVEIDVSESDMLIVGQKIKSIEENGDISVFGIISKIGGINFSPMQSYIVQHWDRVLIIFEYTRIRYIESLTNRIESVY